MIGGVGQDRPVAERTRAEIGTLPFKYQGVEIPVSVSMGVVAQTPDGLKPVEDLLLNADDCLLEAKRRGRNRVVLMGN